MDNYIHLCDYAFASEGGKINIIGIFENINPSTFPYQHPSLFVAARAKAPEGEHGFVIHITEKITGNKILATPIKIIAVPKDKKGINLIVHINEIPFEKAGDFQVALLMDDSPVTSTDLHVTRFA